MKKLKWIIAGLSIVGLAALAFSACGGGSTSCSNNADCDGDQVCWKQGNASSGQCLVNCTAPDNTGACRESEKCVDTESGKQGCAPKSQLGGDAGTGADAGGDGGGADGGNGETKEYKFLHIQDVTQSETPADQDQDENGTDDVDEICDKSDDSITTGADLFGVELVDGDGNNVAWGETLVYNSTTNKMSRTKFNDILDGSSPSLDSTGDASKACPSGDFGSSTIAALGCGGSVIVGFKNQEGNWMALKPEYKVRVFEYGAQCFENCDPNSNYALCGREYVEVGACPADKTASDLSNSSTGSNGKFDGCSGSSDLTLSVGNGFTTANVGPLWD